MRSRNGCPLPLPCHGQEPSRVPAVLGKKELRHDEWFCGLWLAPVALLMVLCIAAMAGMMMGHGHRRRDHVLGHDSSTGESHGHRSGTHEHVLAERLARGEIDVDDYERRLSALRRTDEVDRTWEVAP